MGKKKGGRPKKYHNEETLRASNAERTRRWRQRVRQVEESLTTHLDNLQIIHDPHSLLTQVEVEGLSQSTDPRQGIQAEGLSVPIDADLEVNEYF
jgi:hypothetical protein